jgi:hypothetical protein
MRISMPQVVLCAVAVSLSACSDPDLEALDEDAVADTEEAVVSTFCPNVYVCFWPLQGFGGNRQDWGAGASQDWTWANGSNDQKYHSLKNRFTNRVVWTAKPLQEIHCTPPNGERKTAPEFSVFCIGPQGSTCGDNPANYCAP